MLNRQLLVDVRRVARAIMANQVARFAPNYYLKITGETGRGQGEDGQSVHEVADYFVRCFLDYFEVLAVERSDIAVWLRDKELLEYGPGDVPAVALLMLAYGARSVACVDRFQLARPSSRQCGVLRCVLESLGPEERTRADDCFNARGVPESGIKPSRLRYIVTDRGLSSIDREIDLVYSRAVLEHVNDLTATFRDMARALKPGGLAIHQVDLKSHGLHQHTALDFLTWPTWLWSLMHSAKGSPNRWRLDRYRSAIEAAGLQSLLLKTTERASVADVDAVRHRLAKPFKLLDNDTLQCLSFWLVLRAKDDPS